MGVNLLNGSLPKGIGNLINLIILDVDLNYLAGVVPEEIGKLKKIGQLYLDDNKFSGPIPSSLGNMTSLIELCMEKNNFQGSIPPSLGNCQNLLLLTLYNNNLTGSIPQKLMELSTLSISLDLSNNFLTGSLPSEVGDLVHLTHLDVSNNKLSGDIPSTISSCTSLEGLYLNNNKFEGTIPQSLKDLKGLEKLDISSNNLSGQIPEFIGKLGALKYLNLSYNDFEGKLPKAGIFSNVSGASVLGNHRLCGGIPQLHLPACHKNKHHSSRGPFPPKVVIPISCALAFIIALSCFFSARSMLKKLNIAIDVAFALDYLHNHCETSIVHCDVKPSNVLLDEDMVAHVGDFGLARFLLEASNDPSLSQTMSSQLKGSVGYIPPVDGSVNNDRYERTTLPRRNNREVVKAKKVEDCLFAVMQIGLSCCAVSPRERMLLNMVVGKMNAIRDMYLKVQEG
ncbi:LRR receptor-like serine/threonine-protein kinase [Pyrus ussuriensis x Pyrus communis]|uniref:LRR receptor-like serine/threonine-protein kinase n=1 Tax=Pyrus ussuriensis x Pyrus communis TaxID=2448454 RepID=A0A5N5HRN6_9ROSA|nr:LRR receptor-like serine/threonine-protein kinase [Pyrus ussuriensis x Pyrus communis]